MVITWKFLLQWHSPDLSHLILLWFSLGHQQHQGQWWQQQQWRRGRYSPSYSRSKIKERNVPFLKVRKKFKILVKFWPVLTFEFCKSEFWFKSYAFLTFSILGGLNQRSFAFFSSSSMVFSFTLWFLPTNLRINC